MKEERRLNDEDGYDGCKNEEQNRIKGHEMGKIEVEAGKQEDRERRKEKNTL